MKQDENFILKGNLLKVMSLVGLPLAANGVLQAFYNAIDTLLANRIGAMELASITFTAPVNHLTMAIANGLTVAGTIRIAYALGQGDKAKARKTTGQLVLLVIVFGLLMILPGFFLPTAILKLLGATDTIAENAAPYLGMMLMSSALTFLMVSFIAMMRARGRTSLIFFIQAISLAMKTLISFTLIEMGWGILALSTGLIVANGLIALYVFYFLVIKEGEFKISLSDIVPEFHILWKLLRLGIPVSLERASLSMGHITLNRFVLSFGDIALAGLGITNRFNSMAFNASTGIGTGLSVVIAQARGNRNWKRVRRAAPVGLVLALITGVVLVSVQLLLRSRIAGWFSGSNSILYETIRGSMIVIAPSIVFWSLFQIVIGIFQGMGMTRMPLIIALIRIYVLRIPIVYLMLNYSKMGESSIWYAMLISNFLAAVVAWVLYWIIATRRIRQGLATVSNAL